MVIYMFFGGKEPGSQNFLCVEKRTSRSVTQQLILRSFGEREREKENVLSFPVLGSLSSNAKKWEGGKSGREISAAKRLLNDGNTMRLRVKNGCVAIGAWFYIF